METQNDNKPSYKDFIQNDNTLDNILSNTLDTEEYKNNNYVDLSPSDLPIYKNDSEFKESTKYNDSTLVDVTNLNENTSIIYDIMHLFDDMYVSGRIYIENNYFNLSSNDDFNLVYPNIYIGNYSTTTNYELLKGLGITHIISVIPSFNPAFEDKFKYLHIQAYDDEVQDMKMYFDTTNEFIKECLLQGGKVLIHCMVGRSRSITIFIAFLIFIVKGFLNQSIVKIEDENIYSNDNFNIDNCNIIEYRKLSENNKKHRHYVNPNSYSDTENISKNEQEIPRLSKKEENFILYKKRKMIDDIDNIIVKYKLLKKDLYNFNNETFVETEENNELFTNMKFQFTSQILKLLLNYVTSHRAIAMPNPNFLNQLSQILF